jgi:hypothetical protein
VYSFWNFYFVKLKKEKKQKNKNLKHQKKFDTDYFLKQEMNFLLLNIIIIIVNCNNYIT